MNPAPFRPSLASVLVLPPLIGLAGFLLAVLFLVYPQTLSRDTGRMLDALDALGKTEALTIGQRVQNSETLDVAFLDKIQFWSDIDRAYLLDERFGTVFSNDQAEMGRPMAALDLPPQVRDAVAGGLCHPGGVRLLTDSVLAGCWPLNLGRRPDAIVGQKRGYLLLVRDASSAIAQTQADIVREGLQLVGMGTIGAGLLLLLAAGLIMRPVAELTRRVSVVEEGGALATTDFTGIQEIQDFARVLERTMLALQSRERELDAVLTAVPAGILVVDDALRIRRMNPSAEAIFGWREVEVAGRELEILVPAMAKPIHRLHALDFVTDQAPDPKAMADARTVTCTRRDGTTAHLLITLSKLQTEHGTIAIAAIKDVTDLEQQRRQLAFMSADLEEQLTRAQAANHSKTKFMAALSHELRTPLNAIIGFSDFIVSDVDDRIDPATRRDYAADIRKAGQHLLGLINDLIDMARIEEDRIELHLMHAAPAELARDALHIIGPVIRDKGLRFETDLPADLPKVVADPRAVSQILINLLANAAKFTATGGAVRLKAHAVRKGSPTGGTVAFVVEDEGIGIPADKIGLLGQPFTQLGDHWHDSNTAGLGLGLAISRRLAERMDGSLVIESRYGAWTRVTLTLPLAPVEPEVAAGE